MTSLRRKASLLAAVALGASAYMCSRSPQGQGGGAGDNGHIVYEDGSADTASGGSGGTIAGSGGIGATGGGDAGPTGILPCASLPPSSEPVPAGWPAGAKRLPALDPDVYVFEVPPDPTPLTWKVCGTGCKELVNTWAPSLGDGLWVDTIGAAVGNTPWLILRRRHANYVGTWIGPADGGAVHMLAEEVSSGTVPHGFSSPAGIGASGFVVSAELHETSTWEMGATLDGPLRCMFEERGFNQLFSELATSSTRWALWPQGNGPGWSSQLPIGSAQALLDPVPIPAGYTRGGGFVGLPEGFVMTGYQPVSCALFIWTPAAGTVPFVAAPPPDASDTPVASDGNRIAWLHGSGLSMDAGQASWSKVELMLATDNGQFPVTGTSVGVLPTFEPWTDTQGPSALRGDYFAGWLESGWPHPVAPERLVPFVLRLSDHRIWIIPPRSPDVRWRNILYLSDDEIGLLERSIHSFTGYADTVVRYRLDSLGPGETLGDALDAGVP